MLNHTNARGYHLPALYAPPGMWSWKSTREQLLKGADNPEEKKVYFNNCLGVPYEDAAIRPLDPNDLRNCIDHAWPEDRLPEGVGYITAGIDTHPSHVDIVLMGWGRDGERWVIEHQRLDRDSNNPETWGEVYQLLQRKFLHFTGRHRLRIAATFTDAGGHNTGAVYDFCRGKEREFILAIKGSQDRAAPIAGHPAFRKEADIHLIPVGKLATHGRLFSCLARSLAKVTEIRTAEKKGLKLSYDGQGVIHFHPNLSDDFYKEIVAPRAEWVRKNGKDQLTYRTVAGVADHAHDCMRYADAARDFMHQDIDEICSQLDKESP